MRLLCSYLSYPQIDGQQPIRILQKWVCILFILLVSLQTHTGGPVCMRCDSMVANMSFTGYTANTGITDNAVCIGIIHNQCTNLCRMQQHWCRLRGFVGCSQHDRVRFHGHYHTE